MEKQVPIHLTSMKCLIITIFLFTSCGFSDEVIPYNEADAPEIKIINQTGTTVVSRFKVPNGFKRITGGANSFSTYLRNLNLHPHGKKVKLYNGNLKGNQSAQAAVLKIDVGKRDLQQCADAVMRLRAEYLYKEKKYEKLHFNFTNGFNAKYSTWRKGKGISVIGNKVRWVTSASSNGSYKSFRKYMDKVFMFAGTASLEKELLPKDLKDIGIGDVFIKGAYPGHAVLVIDMAENTSGDKVFMLAQSYMPAQEIHILNNPKNKSISPWYKLSEINEHIETPEWTFDSNQLRSFK